MDGTQIIRKASFASKDPQKYGRYFTRINVDNYIPYKVFNRVEGESSVIVQGSDTGKSKFVKVFFDTTRILLNMNNEVFPQGTGPLFLKRGDGVYKFTFNRINENSNNDILNVDLSGVYNYALLFTLDDNTKIEIPPTYSSNMNVTLGELEFKISQSQIDKLLNQNNNVYSIIIKNPDGTSYTFYEGFYFPYSNYQQVVSQYTSIFKISDMQNQISKLEIENQALKDEISALKAS